MDETAPDLIILDMSDPATPVKLSESSGNTPLLRSEILPLRKTISICLWITIWIQHTMAWMMETVIIDIRHYGACMTYQTRQLPNISAIMLIFVESGDMLFIHHATSEKNFALINTTNKIRYFEISDPLFLINGSVTDSSTSYIGADTTGPSSYRGRMTYSDFYSSLCQ